MTDRTKKVQLFLMSFSIFHHIFVIVFHNENTSPQTCITSDVIPHCLHGPGTFLSFSFIFKAKAQRANVLLKMGRLDEAHIDAENVLRKDPEHEDANRVYAGVEVMKVNIFLGCRKTCLNHSPFQTHLGEASRGGWPLQA